MTASIAPKSDQWNADDLVSRTVTVTIESVVKGSNEQPVDVRLVESPGKAYRPSKSMRRVMVEAWGMEASAYTGHKLTLFRNPKIKFGGMVVGGIEISHMSHITKPLKLNLTQKKGSKAYFTVQPLADAPTAPAPIDVATITDLNDLAKLWKHAPRDSAERTAIEARVAELKAAQTDVDPWADEAAAIAARDAGETA